MLYGRDAERAQIGALLEAARASKSSALVVAGEPGIGKTALLLDTKDRAADMHVLSARGVESESELPFAALHQLLRPALDHLDRLPAPQANALRGALGLGEAAGESRFLVFAACLSLLSELAERRPVLCLVDDAHWLDTASADALRFVARRLDAEGIVMVFGVRDEALAAFQTSDLALLRLGGLDADAADRLLGQGLATAASPHVRERLLAQTQGNALALIEVPSALTAAQLVGDEPLPEALPMTHQVESVFLERVRRLSADAQHLLLVAAADDSESAATVVLATRRGDAAATALGEAESAGLIAVHGSRFEFRHPLVRSAVYGAATSSERRAAHQALADAMTGDGELDRRAWHLAAAALEPDEDVVRALDEAAARAESRAAYPAAVRAFERAAELTSVRATRGHRLAEAARCASLVSADEHAADLARRALPLTNDPREIAELNRALALAEVRRGRPGRGVPIAFDAARSLRESDPAEALELLLDGAWAANEAGDPALFRELAELVAEIGPAAPGERAAFITDLLTGLSVLASGDRHGALEPLRRVVESAEDTDDPRQVIWSGSAAIAIGDYPHATALLERGARLARARGVLGLLSPALCSIGLLEFLGQRFEQAKHASLQAIEFAEEVGAENLTTLPQFVLASIAAIRGDDDEAERRAAEAFELATAHDLPLGGARPIWSLALLDLAHGRWAEALARLETMTPRHLGMGGMLVVQTLPDRIEAAVRAGEREAAERALKMFDEWPTGSATWIPPRLASCRALLAEGEEATAHFEEALRLSADARPFDLARIHLLYGEHLRRERRRQDARGQLRNAYEAFERLKARPWAERAQTELRASGETARRRDPSTTAQLTQQELQIARFVAEGMSNKEVAAQLFLSPSTIDSHLRNIFSKLAINSRTQLARLSLDRDGSPEAAAV